MGSSLTSLIDAASSEVARLHRAGVNPYRAVRAAARAVRRRIYLNGGTASGVGQEAETKISPTLASNPPDLPAAVLVGIGAVLSATGKVQTGILFMGSGWVYHLLRG